MESFKVKTSSFEGPLDLLLELIEKRKLFIGDIALAQVTDDFIAYIKRLDTMPMDESAHFILIASTLLLIKSKSLLPQLSLTEEEKGDIHNLEIRLKTLKRIKEASIHISKLFGEHVIFEQSHMRPMKPVFAPDPSFTLDKAYQLLRDLIQKLPKKEALPQVVVKKVISLEEMIDALTTRVTGALRMSFRQFTGEHKEHRVNVIVSFLAMLQLVRDGVIHATQERHFADITLETKEIGVPRYE